jgi:hypothetical protein
MRSLPPVKNLVGELQWEYRRSLVEGLAEGRLLKLQDLADAPSVKASAANLMPSAASSLL